MESTTIYDEIKEYIDNLSDYELLNLYNTYCETVDCYDDEIYDMDCFDEILYDMKPWEVARACFYGDFRPCDKFFRFNSYGNLESMDYIGSEVDL